MEKLVTLNISGEFDKGFVVQAEVRQDGGTTKNQANLAIAGESGKLPPHPELLEQYRHWQSLYNNLEEFFPNRLKNKGGFTNASDKDEAFESCRKAAKLLAKTLNTWLQSPDFQPIVNLLQNHLQDSTSTRILLATENHWLRRLPWCEWNLLEHIPNAEIVLASPKFKQVKSSGNSGKKEKVKILVILGDNAGTDADEEVFKQLIPDAEICWLKEPQRRDLDAPLWEKQWDILFFAGHGKTENDGSIGKIQINSKDTLTIDEIKNHLKRAINNGLKLAIFSACDGLGIAYQLAEGEDLYLPQIIVMREILPIAIAPKFLQHFLKAYTQGLSLSAAIRESRKRLQILESDVPCVSWLPVLCQNPAEIPLRWHDLVIPPNPYQGLSAFQEKDAALFFGRETFTNQLVKVVETKKLVAVIGASVSGKSSVVLAGLIPSLRQQENWLIANFRPESTPFENLAKALLSPVAQLETGKNEGVTEVNADEINQLATDLQEGNRTLSDVVKSIGSSRRFLLVIDQFEEIYTYPNQKNRQFLDCLLDAVQNFSAFRLVITLRVDFLNQAIKYDPFREKLDYWKPEFIGGMMRTELQAAIEEPAKKRNVYLETGLTEHILNEVGEEQGNLPLLEFALEELWKQQENGLLTRLKYDEIGGVKKALCTHAEGVYDALLKKKEGDQERTKQIFMKLVSPGEGTEYTRQLATRAEVGEENWDLVTHLATARLVVSNRNETTEIETVEIVHEALIKAWPDLRKWIEENDAFLRWKKRLKVAFLEWERNENKEGYLLQGAPLGEAEGYLLERLEEISKAERVFIQLGLGLRDRNRRRTILGLTSGLLAVSIFAVGAVWQWQRAEFQTVQVDKQRQEADKQRINAELIASSLLSGNLFDSNKRLEALIEAIKAGRQLQQTVVDVKPDIRDRIVLALQQAVYGVRERNRLEGNNNGNISLLNSIKTAAFSPDGKIIVTIGDQINIWNREGTLLKTFDKDTSSSITFHKGSFSPNGKMIAVGLTINPNITDPFNFTGIINAVQIWSIDGKLLKTIKAHSNFVNAVKFSPDGQIIASSSSDKTVKLWSLDGRLLRTLQHSGIVKDMSFSPDGRTIIAADYETVKLWGIDGREIKNLQQHSSWIGSVSFSPDGQMIASMSPPDGVVKLWSINGTEIKTLKAHDSSFFGSVNFSPDGQTIASTGKEIKLWSSNGTLLDTLEGHNASIENVSFSPDGKMIASGSFDGTVKLWNRETIKPPTISSSANSFSFSPDSKTIALAKGKEVKLYTHDGTLLKTIEAHTNTKDVSFSPDGKTIVSIGGFNAEGEALRSLVSSKPGTFSNEERFLDFGIQQLENQKSRERTIKLWSLDGRLLKTIDATNQYIQHQGHQSGLTGVIFGPDGTIASTSWDKTVQVWSLNGSYGTSVGSSKYQDLVWSISVNHNDTATAVAHGNEITLLRADVKETQILKGHSKPIFRISFSPDGQTIASASLDGTVKLWNLDGKELKTLKHDSEVTDVSFSPDGKTILTAGMDGLRLWNLSGQRLSQFGGRAQKSEEFSGVGFNIEFNQDTKFLTVVKVLENSPAKKAGIKVGDQILAIDGNSTTDMSLDYNINLLRGEAGTKVVLKIVRQGNDAFDVTITRDIIKTNESGDIRYITAKFSPDGQIIAAGSGFPDLGTVKLWSRDGRLLKTLTGHKDLVWDVSFSPNGKMLASASDDKTVKLWSIDDGKELKTLNGHSDHVLGVSFSPDGQMLASAGKDGIVRVWRIDGTLVKPLLGNHRTFIMGNPNSISFSPDGKTLALANEEEVQLWNPEGTLLKISRSGIRAWFAPDGNVLTSGGDSDGHGWDVNKVSFSPDGKILASASSNNEIKLWNPDGSLLKTLEGHTNGVKDVSFSPDGKILASASNDQTVRLWNLKDKSHKILRGHNSVVNSVSFSSSGLLASGSMDNTLKLWLSDGTLLKTFNMDSFTMAKFSPDGKTLAVGSKSVTLWNFDLDDLMVRGCDWARDYLKTNPNVKESDRTLCEGINKGVK